MNRRTPAIATAALLGVLALSGCTHLAQLQPVAGDEITSVQTATSDVLSNKKVDVIVWPICTFADKVYTCNGTASGGRPITSSAPGNDPLVLTVKVAGTEIYTGKVEDVITAAGRMP